MYQVKLHQGHCFQNSSLLRYGSWMSQMHLLVQERCSIMRDVRCIPPQLHILCISDDDQAYSQVLMVGGGGRWECSNNGGAVGGGEGSLYTTLKALRKQQADVLQQPAFCVFGNAVLDEIVLQRPTSMHSSYQH